MESDSVARLIAALCIFEELGYLMTAATAESHRKRGAQQALIAKRIERVEQMGCSTLVSETLYMLEHSYRNLRRAGFVEAYEKKSTNGTPERSIPCLIHAATLHWPAR